MSWFRAQASGERRADVWIDKAIGSDWAPDWWADLTGEQTARQFIDAIDALGELDEITVHLNSPGGEVYSGLVIMNYLRNHRATVHMRVEGTAASIASVILMAGDTRTMGIGTTVLVHDAMGWMEGFYTESEMRERADGMSKIRDAIVQAYMVGTGQPEDAIRELLSKGDNILTADDAIQFGLATDKDDALMAVASADVSLFKAQIGHATELRQLQHQVEIKNAAIEELTQQIDDLKSPAAADAAAVIAQCASAGFAEMAARFVADKFTQNAVDAQLKSAMAVRDVCKAAGIDHAGVIAKLDDPVDMLRTGITDALAAADQDLDHLHAPGPGISGKQPNSSAAYNQLNNRG